MKKRKNKSKGKGNFLNKIIFLILFFVFSPNVYAGELRDATSRQNVSSFDGYAQGEVLVKFKEQTQVGSRTPQAKIQMLNNKAGSFATEEDVSLEDTITSGNIGVFKTNKDETVEELVARLKNNPDVEYAEPNYFRYPMTINTNDTFKDNLWGLDNTGQTVNGTAGTIDADIDAPEAWDINEGTNAVLSIAVIDSGIAYNHPDLASNMWDGANCVDNNGFFLGGCVHGYDYANSDKIPLPGSSHGTFVSGIISAVKNNSMGVMGVAPNSKLVALKVDDANWGNYMTDCIIKSIDFARQNGIKIINASYGGTSFSQAEYESIKRFTDAGGIFVAAAGNSSTNNNNSPFYPSSYNLDGIIAVTGTTQTDAQIYNYGTTTVDVGAPATNIYSTSCASDCTSQSYSFWQGTSFSTPYVAGLVALVWGYNPTLTPLGVKNIIMSTGDSLASLSTKTLTGKRINAYNALNAVANSLATYIPNAGYTVDNVIPANQIGNIGGVLTINFKVKDAYPKLTEQLNNFSYSTDGGTTWQTPTNGDNSFSLSSRWKDNSYVSSLDYSGTTYNFTFNTKHTEAVGLSNFSGDNVKIRFKVTDGINVSDYVVSENFNIDNYQPELNISQPTGVVFLNSDTYNIIGNATAGSLIQIYRSNVVIGSFQLAPADENFLINVNIDQDVINILTVKAIEPIFNKEKLITLPPITEGSAIYGWKIQNNAGLNNWLSIASSIDGTKIVATDGYIYTSSDGGINWIERMNDAIRYWKSVTSSSDGNKLAAVSSYGDYIYTSINGGIDWKPQVNSGLRNWSSIVSSSSGEELVATDYNGYIYTSIDSGVNWTQQVNSGMKPWEGIASSSDGQKLTAIVYNDYVYRSTDGGINWTPQSSVGTKRWNSIASSYDGEKLIAGVNSGYLYTSNNGGADWIERTSPGSCNWASVSSSADGTKLASGCYYNGYLYISNDGGENWIRQNDLGVNNWRPVFFSPNGLRLIVSSSGNGENGYIYTYNNIISPPTTTTTTTSSITTTTATLNGNITNTGGENPTTRGFEYGTTVSYGTTTTETGSYSTGAYTKAISGLTCNTTYHFRSYATNSIGTGTSADATFTTSACPTSGGGWGGGNGGATSTTSSPSVYTYNTSSISQTSVVLNGSIGDTGGATITTRGFEYGLSKNYGSTVLDTGAFLVGSFSKQINSLTCATTYHVRAFAVNSVGKSYGEDRIFTTSVCGTNNNLPVLNTTPAPAVTPTTEIICPNGKTLASNCTLLPVLNPLIKTNKTNFVFTKNISLNNINEEVKELQKFLNKMGYFVAKTGAGSSGKETTKFGSATKKALIKFQKENKIPATGFFGPKTREVINGILKKQK